MRRGVPRLDGGARDGSRGTEPRDERSERQRGQGLERRDLIPHPPSSLVQIEIDRNVRADGRDDPARERRVTVRPDVLAELPGNPLRVVQHGVKASVLSQELGGRLLAHPRNARDVVRRVAFQAEEVRHLLRHDAVALHDRIPVIDDDVGDALLRADHAHVLVHELEGVLVTCHEQDAATLGRTARRERAEHVVAFPSVDLYDRDRERAKQLLDHRELRLEIRVGRRPLHLVLRERLDAERRLAAVERHDDTVGTKVRDHLEEHRHEAEDRVGRPSVRRRHRRRQSVERAMHEAVAIDDGQGTLGHVRPFGYALAQGACGRADSTRGGRRGVLRLGRADHTAIRRSLHS